MERTVHGRRQGLATKGVVVAVAKEALPISLTDTNVRRVKETVALTINATLLVDAIAATAVITAGMVAVAVIVVILVVVGHLVSVFSEAGGSSQGLR